MTFSKVKKARSPEWLPFIFITGIAKFTKMSVFSALNNFTDISIMPKYGAIVGFTHEELKKHFPGYIKAAAAARNTDTETALEQIKGYYSGFCFDGKTRVYNPFSTLSFFSSEEKEFKNYWFASGSSEYLARYMKDRRLTVEEFRGIEIDANLALTPGDINSADPWSFLYQGGYLTLRPGFSKDSFTLDYPNREVLQSMSMTLMHSFLGDAEFVRAKHNLLRALKEFDAVEVTNEFNNICAKIPFDQYTKAIQQRIAVKSADIHFGEWLCHSSLLTFLTGCGLDVSAEVHGSREGAGLVFNYNSTKWALELKFFRKNENADDVALAALRQALEKECGRDSDSAIVLGIAINGKPEAGRIEACQASRPDFRLTLQTQRPPEAEPPSEAEKDIRPDSGPRLRP
jgi:hypothetical protein